MVSAEEEEVNASYDLGIEAFESVEDFAGRVVGRLARQVPRR